MNIEDLPFDLIILSFSMMELWDLLLYASNVSKYFRWCARQYLAQYTGHCPVYEGSWDWIRCVIDYCPLVEVFEMRSSKEFGFGAVTEEQVFFLSLSFFVSLLITNGGVIVEAVPPKR